MNIRTISTLSLILLSAVTCHSRSLSSDNTRASSQTDSTAVTELARPAVVRRSIAEGAIQVGLSVAVNAVATELLKHKVHRMRPDGTEDNSFPSRHTSWAFTLSTIASNELYGHSPWWPAGFQAAASAVGIQRVLSKRHYPSDVAAGAFTGVLSTEIGYTIGRLIMGDRRSAWTLGYPDINQASLDMTTDAIFPLGKAGHTSDGSEISLGAGFGSEIMANIPVGETLSASAGAAMEVYSIRGGGKFLDTMTLLGAQAGGGWRRNFGYRESWTLETTITAGAGRLLHTDGWNHSSYSFYSNLRAGITHRVTAKFAFGARAGYRIMTVPHAVSAITVGVFSRAVF